MNSFKLKAEELRLQRLQRELTHFMWETEDHDALLRARNQIREIEQKLSDVRLNLYASQQGGTTVGYADRYDESY